MYNAHHSRELRIATMCAGLRVTTETSDLREVEAELVLQPIDGVTGATGQDADEVVAGEFAGLEGSIGVLLSSPRERHSQISWCPRRTAWRCRGYQGPAGIGFPHR